MKLREVVEDCRMLLFSSFQKKRICFVRVRSVGKCEGVNRHTPKATPTLGDGIPMDS